MVNQDNYDNAANMAADLDRFANLPDDVLYEVVTRDGLCFWVFDREDMPELTGEDTPDRELAARLCAGCPVMDECLELELRTSGDNTVGVWGGLPENDRRAVHRVWKVRHVNRPPRGGEW